MQKYLALIMCVCILIFSCATDWTETTELATEPTAECTEATELATEPTAKCTEATEPTTVGTTSQEDDLLNILLSSEDPSVWSSVATYENATTDQLIKCAEKCAKLTNYSDQAASIAKKIIEHEKTNAEVIKILADSCYASVLKEIAGADANDADSLCYIAQKLNESDTYSLRAYEIAQKLAHHEKANSQVVKVLADNKYTGVLNEIADADANDADSLCYIAQKLNESGTYSTQAYDIAKKLIDHSSFSAEVAVELTNSKFAGVRDMAYEALEKFISG